MIPRVDCVIPPLRYDFSLITDYKLPISGLGMDSAGWIAGVDSHPVVGMVAIRKIAILFAVVIGRRMPSVKYGAEFFKIKRVMYLTINGIIKNASTVWSYAKRDGAQGEKCVLHIVSTEGAPYPLEVAVSCTGELTHYARMIGAKVEVTYVCRVFEFFKGEQRMYGNDLYARSIRVVD